MPKSGSASTESTDNYLKAVFELTAVHQLATTTAISRRLHVSAASVTGMLKKLANARPSLITYKKSFGAELTEVGYQRAVEVIRHHRLIETYLYEALGYGWDEVHAEAERLEHFISEDLEDRMAARLGYPEYDPHGHPIPRRDGTIPPCSDIPLIHAEPGNHVRVSRVDDEHSESLRALKLMDVGLHEELEILESRSEDGSVYVRRKNQRTLHLAPSVVSRVRVTVVRTGVSIDSSREGRHG